MTRLQACHLLHIKGVIMEKFVVIGTGFIGQYMEKGMKNIAHTDKLYGIAYGIKGHAYDTDKRSMELGYQVSANNTAEILRKVNPSIIIFSAPPEAAPGIVRDTLAPYYNYCKANNIRIPDLYSFIPSPSREWMCQELGGDVNVVKILPNIIDKVCGYNLAPIGINYVSYASHTWSFERKELLMKCMAPYGYTVATNDKDSLVLLAGKITSHVCYEVSFAIHDVCKEFGLDVEINSIGSAMRKAQYLIFNDLALIGRCDDRDIPDLLKPFFKPFMNAWFKGLNRFTMENKDITNDSDAVYIDMCSFALNVFPIRYKNRDDLMQDTKNAATKGGILERGVEFFYEEIESHLKDEIKNILNGRKTSNDFFTWVSNISYQTSIEAYNRSLDLTGKK